MSNDLKYSIKEHIHRYGLWTAARAGSKSLLSNYEVKNILDGINLKKELEQLRVNDSLTDLIYREWLNTLCTNLIAVVNSSSYKKKKRISYGIAAKIISIYIKTVEIIPTQGLSKLSTLAYPPIDSILLKNINKKHEQKLDTRWSLFDWQQYIDTIDQIKKLIPNLPMWQLEQYWQTKKY